MPDASSIRQERPPPVRAESLLRQRDAARTPESGALRATDWPRRVRVWLLGLAMGLGVLLLDVAAHPELELGPLYSGVIVVLSLTGHRLTVVIGTVLVESLMIVGTLLWPPGWGMEEHVAHLTLSTSFLCLVAGLLLHRMSLDERLATAFAEREQAWAEVKVLRGLLRVCAWCKRIQDHDERWVPIEIYVASHSEAGFTHGICPECAAGEGGTNWNRAQARAEATPNASPSKAGPARRS